MDHQLTPRQRREKEFHEQYASYINSGKSPLVDFHCVESLINNLEHRPWEEYWFIQELVLEEVKKNNKAKILDFGCGEGLYSLNYAKMGYEVEAFDICDNYVQIATQRAKDYGLSDKIHIKQGIAEKLEYPNNYFDVIAGIDILHHVNIAEAISECHRVLKPGGLAFFKEPIESTIFDAVRNTSIIKKFAPNSKSFETYITDDEKKLNKEDFQHIRAFFPECTVYYFRLFSRFDKLISNERAIKFLKKLDRYLIRLFPVQSLCGEVVLKLKKLELGDQL